jgi:ubiquitin-protein ligase
MADRAQKRINRDYMDMVKSTDELAKNGVYFHVNEEDMMNVYAMFVGCEKTPYHHGFYFIKFTYPSTYPMDPPKAFYATQGQVFGRGFRFNPNLYVCGKVCLSMLGTWSGPGWMPVNTIINVFMAVQALVLNDYPIKNEPGYASHSDKSPEVANYNRVVEYANIKVGILEMMEKPPKEFEAFKPVMEKYFVEHFSSIVENVNQYKELVAKNKGMVSCSYAHVNGTCDYDVLLARLHEKYEKLTGSAAAAIAAPTPTPASEDVSEKKDSPKKKSAKATKSSSIEAAIESGSQSSFGMASPAVAPGAAAGEAASSKFSFSASPGAAAVPNSVFKIKAEYGIDIDPEILAALGDDPEAIQAAILMAKGM